MTCEGLEQANNLPCRQTDILWTFSVQDMAGEPFWGCLPKSRITFGRIIFECGILILLAPNFRLFQWRLGTLFRLTPRASVRLTRILIRTTQNGQKGSKELCLKANYMTVTSSESELMVRRVEERISPLLNLRNF